MLKALNQYLESEEYEVLPHQQWFQRILEVEREKNSKDDVKASDELEQGE